MSLTQQFLYRIQPTRAAKLRGGSSPEESKLISQHSERLERLMAEGVVILAGRALNTDPSSFGIVVFNAASEAAAQAIMNDDPVVKGGVMRAELFPYSVARIAEANAR